MFSYSSVSGKPVAVERAEAPALGALPAQSVSARRGACGARLARPKHRGARCAYSRIVSSSVKRGSPPGRSCWRTRLLAISASSSSSCAVAYGSPPPRAGTHRRRRPDGRRGAPRLRTAGRSSSRSSPAASAAVTGRSRGPLVSSGEAVLEPGEHRLRRQHAGSRPPPARSRAGGRRAGRRSRRPPGRSRRSRRMRAHRLRAVDEERHRLVLRQRVDVGTLAAPGAPGAGPRARARRTVAARLGSSRGWRPRSRASRSLTSGAASSRCSKLSSTISSRRFSRNRPSVSRTPRPRPR